ncbi:MAG: methylated-DNA--[protein]-cysteine S-methyltransferase [Ruminococcaceae bacterium]|nr:methylated-DNA--[protein]-cysteine S-methyltransferase [Oscillospiraceae bacterium]
MFYRTVYPSPLGEITLVCDDDALVHLSLPGQRGFSRNAAEIPHPILTQTKDWLDRYFAGDAPSPAELPLRPEGTEFRKLIWTLLLQIPYGQTVSYGSLAKQAAAILGKPRMSAQAVGGAVGANPIAIVIPCHRVVGADGDLTGYAGGIHYKRALLELEAPEP